MHESSRPLSAPAAAAPDVKTGVDTGGTMPPNESPLPKRREWLAGTTAAVAALAGFGWAWWRERPAEALTDPALMAFWQAHFETPGGQSLAAAGFKGRPLLINFWATWCPPCVEELPLIEAFYRQNSASGWQVLGIAADKKNSVSSFLTKIPLSFPIAIAGLEGVTLSRSLGNLAGGLPFTVVLGRDGQVVQRKMGQIQPDDLRNWAALR